MAVNRFRIVAALFITLSMFLGPGWRDTTAISAQTPSAWQQNATGLRVSSNADQKTAGLTMTVKTSSTPFVSLQGGIRTTYGKIFGPTGIELGEIKIPNAVTTTLATENADWSHNEMTFSTSFPTQLKIWVSRLSPALLIQSQENSLRLFSGNLSGAIANGTTVSNRPASPSYPRYVAYSTGGNIQVRPLSTIDLALPSLDSNWIMVWYGANSHFADSRLPMGYSWLESWAYALYPQTEAYQADAPMLLMFQNAPSTIRQSNQGGIDLTFAGSAGFSALMPLLGRDHPRSADTESWSQGLPSDIVSKLRFWSSHLCYYPTVVAESYSYDANSDIASIGESVNFLTACASGTPFSILPTSLSLAKDSMGITVSGTVIDSGLSTEFGPVLGIDNVTAFDWQVPGLKRYTDDRRVVTGAGTVPADLQAELNAQVDKLINGGHYRPWMFADNTPRGATRGDIYFLNPAEVIYQLVEIADALDEPRKGSLIQYLRTERSSYPPETVFNLPNEGTVRGPFGLNNYTTWQSQRGDVFLKGVPLYSLYGLSRFYEVTQDIVPTTVITAGNTALDKEMQERDWASLGWFKGFQNGHVAVVEANRHFAGMVGYVKLAKLSGNTQSEQLGRALLAKAAVLRVAMGKYQRYLYSSGLIRLPSDPNWQPKYTAGGDLGVIFNYGWTGPYDDPQQVAMLDQFGVFSYDHSGYMELGTGFGRDWVYVTSSHLTAYLDMVPELFRLMTDDAKPDTEVYVKKVTAYTPQWYAPFAEGVLGGEHNLSHPGDSFQIFMAKALLQNEPPEALARYAAFSWLESGDLFYMRKLGEVVKQYKGVAWQ